MTSNRCSDALLHLLRQGVADGVLPGAVFRIGRPGKGAPEILAEGATGTMGTPGRTPPMRTDTLFDVASLTKPVVTATAAMLLLEQGILAPERPVQQIIPEFAGRDKERITVGHLLDHSSGLPAWDALYLRGATPAEMLDHLYRLPLETIPGQRSLYSCLGYIVLGEIIARVTGQPLEQLAAKSIFAPLRMCESLFRPPEVLHRRIAPTDMNCYFERKMTGKEGATYPHWIQGIVRGVANDGNARGLGGVAGNAGLFSTVADLSRFAEMVLRRGEAHSGRFLRPETLALMLRDRGEGRSFGWEVHGLGRVSSGGGRLSAGAIGHSGFTGVSMWIDPSKNIYFVLLTNRTFFGARSAGFPNLRRRFHELAMEQLALSEG